MTEPHDDATLDDVITPTEAAPRDRQEHAGSPDRVNDDELVHRAEQEADQVHREH